MLSEARIRQLTADWHRYHKEREQSDSAAIQGSYESSIARVETELNREDIDPRNYDDNGNRK